MGDGTVGAPTRRVVGPHAPSLWWVDHTYPIGSIYEANEGGDTHGKGSYELS